LAQEDEALSKQSEGATVDLVEPLSQSSWCDRVEQRVSGTWVDTFKVLGSRGILLQNDGSKFENVDQLFPRR
jgi:hypothetical protein